MRIESRCPTDGSLQVIAPQAASHAAKVSFALNTFFDYISPYPNPAELGHPPR
jgi:hypothetical protein